MIGCFNIALGKMKRVMMFSYIKVQNFLFIPPLITGVSSTPSINLERKYNGSTSESTRRSLVISKSQGGEVPKVFTTGR